MSKPGSRLLQISLALRDPILIDQGIFRELADFNKLAVDVSGIEVHLRVSILKHFQDA